MTKDLKSKAINIQGKAYVLVSDRVLFFNETYQKGSIKTELVSQPSEPHIIIKATVTPDSDQPNRIFTGYSQAVVGEGYINKTSALENAETSAVGRALALMGIGVIDSIASVDEINKATGIASRPAQEMKRAMNAARPQKVVGETCPACGGKYIKGKTGTVFCENKCWLPENRHLTENRKAAQELEQEADTDEIKVENIPF